MRNVNHYRFLGVLRRANRAALRSHGSSGIGGRRLKKPHSTGIPIDPVVHQSRGSWRRQARRSHTKIARSLIIGLVGTAIVSFFLVVQLYPGVAVPVTEQTTPTFSYAATAEHMATRSTSPTNEIPVSPSQSQATTSLTLKSDTVEESSSAQSKSAPPIVRFASPLSASTPDSAPPNTAPPQTLPSPDQALKQAEIEAHQATDMRRLANLAPETKPQISEAPVRPTPAHPDIDSLRWRRVTFAKSRLSVSLPARLFKRSLASPSRKDKIWATNDGRALFRFRRDLQANPFEIATVRRELLKQRYALADLSEDTMSARSLTVAGTLADERFHQRVLLSCGGRERLSWTIIYPLAEKIFFEKVSQQIFGSIIDSQKTKC